MVATGVTREIDGLIQEKWYRFAPPVRETGLPVGGIEICEPEECTFCRGQFVAMWQGKPVFIGKPVDEKRVIAIPAQYRNAVNLREISAQLHMCYFRVTSINAISVEFDPDQTKD